MRKKLKKVAKSGEDASDQLKSAQHLCKTRQKTSLVDQIKTSKLISAGFKIWFWFFVSRGM